MQSLKRIFGTFAAALAALAVVLSSAPDALADKLHLKDGRVLEGKVERELDGNIWFAWTVGQISQTQFFAADQVVKVEKDEAEAAAPKDAVASREPVTSKGLGQATRVAILNFGPPGDWPSRGLNAGSTVGIQVCAQAFEEALPMLEADKVDVVVIRINSGGGMVLEMPKLNDLYHEKYKKKFRTVAWVESAISAAAMSPWCLEEIYFMPQGNMGACTAFFGASLVAMKDVELEQLLKLMEKYSARGRRDPKIMRSMQIEEPLSCTIDENGDVHWFQDLSGDYIVNGENRILTFNARDAVRFKFAKGIAATKDELADMMGLREVEWVGQRAADHIDKFMLESTRSEKEFNEIAIKYERARGTAQGLQDRQQRGAEVNRARRFLNELRRHVRINKNFELLRGTDSDWFEEQERILDRLMR